MSTVGSEDASFGFGFGERIYPRLRRIFENRPAFVSIDKIAVIVMNDRRGAGVDKSLDRSNMLGRKKEVVSARDVYLAKQGRLHVCRVRTRNVKYRLRLTLSENGFHFRKRRDIALVVSHSRQSIVLADVEDMNVGIWLFFQDVTDNVGTNESAAAGDQNRAQCKPAHEHTGILCSDISVLGMSFAGFWLIDR